MLHRGAGAEIYSWCMCGIPRRHWLNALYTTLGWRRWSRSKNQLVVAYSQSFPLLDSQGTRCAGLRYRGLRPKQPISPTLEFNNHGDWNGTRLNARVQFYGLVHGSFRAGKSWYWPPFGDRSCDTKRSPPSGYQKRSCEVFPGRRVERHSNSERGEAQETESLDYLETGCPQ